MDLEQMRLASTFGVPFHALGIAERSRLAVRLAREYPAGSVGRSLRITAAFGAGPERHHARQALSFRGRLQRARLLRRCARLARRAPAEGLEAVICAFGYGWGLRDSSASYLSIYPLPEADDLAEVWQADEEPDGRPHLLLRGFRDEALATSFAEAVALRHAPSADEGPVPLIVHGSSLVVESAALWPGARAERVRDSVVAWMGDYLRTGAPVVALDPGVRASPVR